jgi:N-acetylglucosamine kinase-like BadF-type ATPase
MSRVLGLDIGGTHCRARLSEHGQVVGEAEADSASLTAIGTERASRALSMVLKRLSLDDTAMLDAICAGSAGTGSDAARAFLVGLLAPLTRSGTVVVVNDARLVLPAAGVGEGVGVICGTGSSAIGNYADREAHSGGWGYLLGDEGSGYWVVREALKVLLDRNDDERPLGQLGRQLMEATEVPDILALEQMFYDHPHPHTWAPHAPMVLDSPDPQSKVIVELAATALAALVTTTIKRLGAPSDLPVVLAGGLLTNQQVLAAATLLKLRSAGVSGEVLTLTEPPITGAVRLAEAAATAVG